MAAPAAHRVVAAAITWCVLTAGCASTTKVEPSASVTSRPPTTSATTEEPVSTDTTVPPALTTSELLTLAQLSVVRVRNTGCGEVSLGSAWLANDGRMVSNRHVVEGLQFLEISTWDGRDLVPRSAEVADGADISKIAGNWLEAKDLRPMTVRTERVAPGEPVSLIGFPEGDKMAVSSGEAIMYDVDTDLAPREILKITAPARPGNSGGPVVDRWGHVVGVVYATEIATDDTLVIPISDVFGPSAAPLQPQPPCA